VERYPTETPGTNGRHTYVDVLASRVLPAGAGPAALLREAWDRYRLPLAVTEAHNGCTREEQLRWLDDVWRGAEEARAGGADVRAVTVWSLLGAYDWHTLVTRDEGVYEPGVFDLRAPSPRPTALAAMVRDLAAGRPHPHPVLAGPGWWRRPDRYVYGHAVVDGRLVPVDRAHALAVGPARPIMLAGTGGALGRALARACRARGLPTLAIDDAPDPSVLEAALIAGRPWAVVDASGYELAAAAPGAPRVVGDAAAEQIGLLAAACARQDLPFLTFSSARVFAAEPDLPRLETDPVAPLDVEGRLLAVLEDRILAAHPSALVVRMGPPFGTGDDGDVVAAALRVLATGRLPAVPPDGTVSPTYLPDLVDAALDLLIDGEGGIWHLPNRGTATWAEIAREVGATGRVVPSHSARRTNVPVPPSYGLLESERGWILPPLTDALARHAADGSM